MIGLSYNEMKKRIIFLGCIMGIITLLSSCSSSQNLSMLQFNIWQEGSMIPGGFDAIADEIARLERIILFIVMIQDCLVNIL